MFQGDRASPGAVLPVLGDGADASGLGATARALVLTTVNRAAPTPPARPNVSRSLLQPHHITFSWTPGNDGYAPLRSGQKYILKHTIFAPVNCGLIKHTKFSALRLQSLRTQ